MDTIMRHGRMGMAGILLLTGLGQRATFGDACSFIAEADVNDDGIVDPLDTGFVQSRIGCTPSEAGSDCDKADANQDGKVDPLDVGYIQSRLGCNLNLALHQPYEFDSIDHEPTYCYDADDPALCPPDPDYMKLTDGDIYTGTAKLWIQPESVGWRDVKEPVGITIDLGMVQPIDGVTFDGAAGASGAYFPASLLVFVSDDKENWHFVTNLITEAVPQTAYIQHQFEKKGLHTRGRYVAFYALIHGSYLFCDEIEVLAGAFDPYSLDFVDEAIVTDQLAATLMARLPLDVEMTAGIYLAGEAEAAIDAIPGGDREQALAELEIIRADILAATEFSGADRADGLPYTANDQATCEVVGEYMSSAGLAALTLSEFITVDDARLGPFQRPAEISGALEVNMMQDEHEHTAFVLSNNTASSMTVSLSQIGGEGGPSVTFRESMYVLTSGYQFIGDALPLIESNHLDLPAGMSKEVWLDIDSAGVAPGLYESSIEAAQLGLVSYSLPLEIRVYAVQMPADSDYKSHTFAYFGTPIAEEHPEAMVQDLEDHYSWVQALNTLVVPDPFIGLDCAPFEPDESDWANMDAAIDLRPDVELWILLVTAETSSIGELLRGECPNGEAVFQDWVIYMRDHLAAKGITKDKWAFFFTDEPTAGEWANYVVLPAQWVKEIDSQVQIYQNWNSEALDDDAIAAGKTELIDILVPTHIRIKENPALLEELNESGEPLITRKYDSTSALGRNPYYDYRLSHWWSSYWGLSGNEKWLYLEEEQETWNQYNGAVRSMIYPGPAGPIPSKRWEAWRDGIEDHELLEEVRALAEDQGDQALQEFIDEAIFTAVCPYLEEGWESCWSSNMDPHVVEDYRLIFLELLSQ